MQSCLDQGGVWYKGNWNARAFRCIGVVERVVWCQGKLGQVPVHCWGGKLGAGKGCGVKNRRGHHADTMCVFIAFASSSLYEGVLSIPQQRLVQRPCSAAGNERAAAAAALH